MGPVNRKDAAAAVQQWDAFVLGWPLSDIEAGFAETIGQVHAEDDSPHVDSAFSERLGARLLPGFREETPNRFESAHLLGVEKMNGSVSSQSRGNTRSNGRRPVSNVEHQYPNSRKVRGRFSSASLFVIVVLPAGALFCGVQGGYFDMGVRTGSHSIPTPNPENAYRDSETAPAMYRGNAARTGANGPPSYTNPC
jgi:hypothetical protein